MQIPRVSREPPPSSLSSLWLGLRLRLELGVRLGLASLLGPLWRLVAGLMQATLHSPLYTAARQQKEPDKEPNPSPGLVLALPASGVTIARESALDLGHKFRVPQKKKKYKQEETVNSQWTWTGRWVQSASRAEGIAGHQARGRPAHSTAWDL